MSTSLSSSSTTCNASGRAATKSQIGIEPGPQRHLLLGVAGAVAVLDVQGDDPVAEAVQQRGHVGATDDRPVGVDLQDDLGSEVLGQHLQTVPAVEVALDLPPVVVVADPEPVLGRRFGGLVQLAGRGGDVLLGLPVRLPDRGLDHRLDAESLRGREDLGLVAGQQADVGGRRGQPVLRQPRLELVHEVGEGERLDLGESDLGDPAQGGVEVGASASRTV